MVDYVNDSMLVREIITAYPEVTDVLRACGMHCLGCPASKAETLAEACAVHDLETELVLNALNERIERKHSKASGTNAAL